jgi:excinuclease UvrABC ATPase subunit
MVEALSTISNNYPNYDIIFPVGESHIQNISRSLEAKSLDVVIDDSFNDLETVRKTSVLAGILSIELEGTNNALEALQQQIQARQKASEQQLQETKDTTPKAEKVASPESFVERLEQEQQEQQKESEGR